MKNTEKLSYGLLLYGYSVVLGTAYVFAYWRPFGFNIFPYMDPVDFLTAPLDRLIALFAPFILVFIAQLEHDESETSWKLSCFGVVTIVTFHYFFGAIEIYAATAIFYEYSFHFDNEMSVLVFCFLFILFSFLLAIRFVFERKSIFLMICVVAFAQISIALATGYTDGKAVFNGADSVHFLEQKNLCQKGGVRDWVYLEKAGGNAFFMNTIDKRICILDEVKFSLISRKFSEQL